MKTLHKLGLAAVLAASVSSAMASPHGHGFKFKAYMSPAQIEALNANNELTTVDSTATGSATLSFAKDLSSVTYSVNVANTATNIGAAHFHCAPADKNGPPAVVVANSNPNFPVFNNVNAGPITITNANLRFVSADTTCGIEINNISSLLQATLKGLIYINIHTEAFGNPGELRGQFFKPVKR